MTDKPKKALVIGGGIAGLTAAWELAQSQVDVELVEKSPFLGGHSISYCCKATDECVKCGACSVDKMLAQVVSEPRINVTLGGAVAKLDNSGKFSASLDVAPAYIDPAKCDNCGKCFQEFRNTGAVVRGYSKNNTPLYAICADAAKDVDAAKLAGVCPKGAINLDAKATTKKIDADTVIVATGFTPFDAAQKPTYGYGIRENVITGMELEALIRQKGQVVRPSDFNPPAKTAFIQCVGSRDARLGNLWCSQVCCAYGLRMARKIKYANPEAEVKIFYMDIQSIGKNFPAFYTQCKEELGFVRNIPVDVYPEEEGRLRLSYADEDTGERKDEIFDLLVLSIGITPGEDNDKVAELFSLDKDQDGFLVEKGEGVFLAGTAAGPKNIPASMAQAGYAASEALKYIGVTK